MIATNELRRTWAGHTAIEQLCDALDEARARVQVLTQALELIASATKTSSGDIQGATWIEIGHVQIAREALASATPPREE